MDGGKQTQMVVEYGYNINKESRETKTKTMENERCGSVRMGEIDGEEAGMGDVIHKRCNSNSGQHDESL